ncbi:hypothetical protein MSG28_000980 [Choristoneura fumiferana]|uniref:Uncharacterized protein n=1 Tax=Choristoneura fumiferana TaxID=7141 RepID=A0ACC0K3L6_CHOFU|nr:hypothetical protein MSG28_000980 [Choristoneura fumiferana]
MANSVEQQFSELNLSQEDHDQIFEQDDHQDLSKKGTLLSVPLFNAFCALGIGLEDVSDVGFRNQLGTPYSFAMSVRLSAGSARGVSWRARENEYKFQFSSRLGSSRFAGGKSPLDEDFTSCTRAYKVKRDTRRMTPVPDEVGGAGRPPSAGPGRTLWKTHGRGAPWHGPSNKCTSRTAIGFSDK